METLHEKLDLLEKIIVYSRLMNFKFGADPAHDEDLIEWFGKNGELRAYKNSSQIFTIHFVTKNGLTLMLGSFYKGCNDRSNNWQNDCMKKALKTDAPIIYCTNNLLHTPDEVEQSFGEEGKKYRFSNSRETETSMISNKNKLLEILKELK